MDHVTSKGECPRWDLGGGTSDLGLILTFNISAVLNFLFFFKTNLLCSSSLLSRAGVLDQLHTPHTDTQGA